MNFTYYKSNLGVKLWLSVKVLNVELNKKETMLKNGLNCRFISIMLLFVLLI